MGVKGKPFCRLRCSRNKCSRKSHEQQTAACHRQALRQGMSPPAACR